jgi:hypothetical protein
MSAPPVDLLSSLDPNILATIRGIVQSQLDETEQRYRQEIQARHEAWQQREQEAQAREAALQAKIQVLTRELVARPQSGYVLTY